MLKITNSKAQQVQYGVPLLIVVGFELFFMAQSFNIEPPEWFKYVIVTFLLAAVAALL
jgi:hypothetical protein